MKKIMHMLIISFALMATMGMVSPAEAATAKSYQYDTSGRLQSITLPGYKITFTYDKNGNLLKRSVVKAAVTK